MGIGARALIVAARVLPPPLLLRLSSLIAKSSRPQADSTAVTDNPPSATGSTPAASEAEHNG